MTIDFNLPLEAVNEDDQVIAHTYEMVAGTMVATISARGNRVWWSLNGVPVNYTGWRLRNRIDHPAFDPLRERMEALVEKAEVVWREFGHAMVGYPEGVEFKAALDATKPDDDRAIVDREIRRVWRVGGPMSHDAMMTAGLALLQIGREQGGGR